MLDAAEMTTPLEAVAAPVREVLSGRRDGASAVAAAIAEPALAPGWFSPGDPIWTVHGSVATFAGGIRALMLQALHPLALAGVDQHSRYRDDPFGRLQRTGAFIAATTYGSAELAGGTVSAVRRIHESVRGTAPDGRPYRADDDRLLSWVHITLTDSMLAAYQQYGRDGAIDPDGYVADMAVVGSAMGVPQPPADTDELRRAMAGFQPELSAGRDAQRMLQFIKRPPLARPLRPGYRVLAAGAAALLEPPHRALLGWDRLTPRRQRATHGATDALLMLLRTALVESPARAAGERRLGLRGPTAAASQRR
jgi:uncharacterized protein (DUF2236 family)